MKIFRLTVIGLVLLILGIWMGSDLPGSYHLMLIGPESVPKQGERVKLILHFDNGETLQINSPVHKAISGSMMKGSH